MVYFTTRKSEFVASPQINKIYVQRIKKIQLPINFSLLQKIVLLKFAMLQKVRCVFSMHSGDEKS
jgi:hypothetical protein